MHHMVSGSVHVPGYLSLWPGGCSGVLGAALVARGGDAINWADIDEEEKFPLTGVAAVRVYQVLLATRACSTVLACLLLACLALLCGCR